MDKSKKQFYSGTSGLTLPTTKEHFPTEFKEKSHLEYYASLVNSVEINSTFYKLPMASTFVKWEESVSADFRFTFKVPKTISHAKGLDFSEEDVKEFIAVIENMSSKKGCLLLQFPPSVKIAKYEKVKNLLTLLNELTSDSDWNVAVEFRDESCYITEVSEILDELNITMVLHDMPKGATGFEEPKGNVVYLRLHGPELRYRGDYSDEFLIELAEKIKKWLLDDKTVYVYFNNTMGAAFKNLQDLNKFILT